MFVKKEALRKIEGSLKSAFSNIREEMDVHLDSINENTNELGANFDYMMKLESKIDKLNERIDEMQMLFEEVLGMPQKTNYKSQFGQINLTLREQEVFMVLYASNDESLPYSDIARKLGLTIQLVDKAVENMILNGIPIIKKYNEGNIELTLDLEFKNLQAKENVLNINEGIVQSVF